MKQRDRKRLKGYFKTKSVPTDEQFAEFIDSIHNVVEDGKLQSGDDGLILSPRGEANTLLEVYSEDLETATEYVSKMPCWSLVLDYDNNIQLLNGDKDVVFSTAAGNRNKYFKIPADSRWYTLHIEDSDIEQRKWCRAYRIMVCDKYSHLIRHRFTEVTASHYYGQKFKITSPRKRWGIWFSKVKFRWIIINGGVYLQMRSKKNASSLEIKCHISKLWECTD